MLQYHDIISILIFQCKCKLTTLGLNGGAICLFSSFCQSMDLKNGWLLIGPAGQEGIPKRSSTARSNSYNINHTY